MSFKIIKVLHKHCVFTIAKELLSFFLEDHSLLSCLFSAVNSVISRMFFKLNKSHCFTPSFICVLHTFDRDFKWNPHIHCLLSEGSAASSIPWWKVDSFNYRFLRDSFQTALLNEFHSRLTDSFKKVKSSIYADRKNIFYVRALPNRCASSKVINYISRYLGCPVIATSWYILMMATPLPFITIVTKTINRSHRQFQYLNLSPCSHSISLRNISK